jgi:hypothetical protein
MPFYRVTVRYRAEGRHLYHVDDVEADSVADAMRAGAARMPPEVHASADLVEVRVQVDPDGRQFTPG